MWHKKQTKDGSTDSAGAVYMVVPLEAKKYSVFDLFTGEEKKMTLELGDRMARGADNHAIEVKRIRTPPYGDDSGELTLQVSDLNYDFDSDGKADPVHEETMRITWQSGEGKTAEVWDRETTDMLWTVRKIIDDVKKHKDYATKGERNDTAVNRDSILLISQPKVSRWLARAVWVAGADGCSGSLAPRVQIDAQGVHTAGGEAGRGRGWEGDEGCR